VQEKTHSSLEEHGPVPIRGSIPLSEAWQGSVMNRSSAHGDRHGSEKTHALAAQVTVMKRSLINEW
jgi:hypothetical protein